MVVFIRDRTYKAMISKRKSRFPILQHATERYIHGQDSLLGMPWCLYYAGKPHLHMPHYFPFSISKSQCILLSDGTHKLLKQCRFRCQHFTVISLGIPASQPLGTLSQRKLWPLGLAEETPDSMGS